jgi:hypothetical protein
LLLAALLLGSGISLWTVTQAAPLKTETREAFVVHEWGTFSTFSGSDGKPQRFRPKADDLPKFVYKQPYYWDRKDGYGDVFVSLETPVLYFYSEKERTASLRVDLPQGTVTEWYPQASRLPDRRLRWDEIKILPRGQTAPVQKSDGTRYFAARETDANALQVKAKKEKVEHENFLFYRGVGDFTMPVTVSAQGKGAFKVKNTSKEAIPAFILLHAQNSKVRFKVCQHLSQASEMEVQEAPTESTPNELADTMVKLLTEQGLYEKEARAMVKTWRADWFDEPGTRVLYLVPTSVTNNLLAMKVEPKPDSLVRVLVGRHDVLTPEQERSIDHWVKQVEAAKNGTEAVNARKELARLGRYATPAYSMARERIKKQEKPAVQEKK